MKSWKKSFKSAFSGFSLSDLTYGSWKSWKSTSSSYRDDKVPEDIKNAYKQALDLITVMDLPFKVELKLNNDPATGYKSRALKLPTKVFDEPGISEEDKVIISTGQAIHEAEHLKETDLGKIERSCTTHFNRLMSFLIEDERIEDKLLSERPGFFNHIQKVREYDAKKVSISSAWRKLGGIKNGEIFKNLFAMVRYPDLMDEKVYEKEKEVFDEIKDIISQPLFNTEDSINAAKEVQKKIQKYLNELSHSEIVSLNCALSEMKCDILSNTQGGKDSDNPGFDKRGSSSDKLGLLSPKDTRKSIDMDCKIIQGDSEYGTKTSVTFTKSIGDGGIYNTYKKEISPYISSIKKLLANLDKNYEFSVRGMRSGVLDVNKLAEAYQGVPQVYVRKGTVTTNKTRICILIDESGSMSGDYSTVATKAAILLKEAFESIPGTELYIYGHTAEIKCRDSVELFIYQEGTSYNPKYALSSIKGRFQNIDHEAIDEVCTRVRKFTDDHVIMFVLSDGVPAASNYGGLTAMKQVRDVVKKREKDGFDIIQVNIGDELSEEQMREMFDKYVYIKEDISEFPKCLAKIIKKAVSSDKSTKVQVL